MKNNKGFTLVELIAVIVLLAILIAVGFPLINNMIKKSETKSQEMHDKNALIAIETFIVECDSVGIDIGGRDYCAKQGASPNRIYHVDSNDLEKLGFLKVDRDASGNPKYACYEYNITMEGTNKGTITKGAKCIWKPKPGMQP